VKVKKDDIDCWGLRGVWYNRERRGKMLLQEREREDENEIEKGSLAI